MAAGPTNGGNGAGPLAPLVFVHVPKAAGTSLKDLIARVYAGRPMLFFNRGDGRLERFATLPPEKRAACGVVAGHEPYGLHRVFEGSGAEPAVITALREPVARVVSLYRYIFAEPEHFRHAEFKTRRPTVRDVLADADLPAFDNHQVRFLAGTGALGKPFGGLGNDDLDLAKRNLAEGCRAFMLQHRSEASIAWFVRELGWPADASLPSLNAARPVGDAPEVTDADRAAIAEANALDAELLAYAETIFDERAPA